MVRGQTLDCELRLQFHGKVGILDHVNEHTASFIGKIFLLGRKMSIELNKMLRDTVDLHSLTSSL